MPDGPASAAIVTGHTRGLGAGIAAALLARGVRVLGIARGMHEALAGAHGDRLTERRLDLGDAAALAEWIESGELNRFLEGAELALLVNNAGIVQPVGGLDQQQASAVVRAVTLNVAAPLALSAAFVAASRRARDRRILHLSSGASSTPIAGWSVYCASKAALDHHARTVALDRTPDLRTGSIAPGVIDTDMQASIRDTPDEQFPDRARFVALKRQGQLRDPDEVGSALVDLLLSDRFGRTPVGDLRG
jgi:NAD(P)-dependent dehydrogenase (short-subunit alcohol dehydrogenase family)